jgi:tetratricopeptide (TPR) repeat protein
LIVPHDLVDDLRVEIAKGHVLVVVGAGVSIGATGGNPLAFWQGLLQNGVERCVAVRGLDAKWSNRVREEIRSGDMDDLLSAAEKISIKLGFPTGGEYRRWLHESVGMMELKDRSVLDAIGSLGLPIVTTNYDSLLEESTGRPAVTWRQGDKAARVIRGEEPGILHLHGYWDEPESVVLGIRSYEHIRGNQYAQAVLRAIQTFHTLLFIGCGDGLDDPNFGALLAWARDAFQGAEARHYRLCKEGELKELREKHREDRLFPVSYGPKHEDLGPFVRGLGSFVTAVKTEEVKITLAARPSRLPGRPPRCFGREDEVRELVETLLQPSPLSIPLLGPPGVGKTTITLEALHEPQVTARYGGRRFFIQCDGARSRYALVTEICLGVGIESGPDLEDRLFKNLERDPGVLILDNLETPWEADTAPVEDLLTQLSTTPEVILVASVRGDQRPFGPRWREAIRVSPLGLPAARNTFVDVAGARFRSDPDLDRLLEAVDRLPIAVVLMAHQAQGEPDLSGLWKQWQEKRTALLRRADGKERLTNIEVSLDLSLNGPRMTSEARRLLALFALLPEGVAHDDLDALLPGEAGEAAAVLRKVGLAFDQSTRLRVLAPIREYVQRKLAPKKEDLDRAINYYVEFARKGDLLGRPGGAEASSRLLQELGNLDSMISKGFERTDPEPAIRAAVDFGEFIRFSGWGSQEPIERAAEVACAYGRDELTAACFSKLGKIAYARSDFDRARTRIETALTLFRRSGDKKGEAICVKDLGDIALAYADHESARDRYEEALPLFREVGSVQGQANCIQRLGLIALQCSDLEKARARYEEALPLYKEVTSLVGEAICIQALGTIALEQKEYEAACARYEEALVVFCQIGSVDGKASCIEHLGDLAFETGNFSAACDRYEEALPLYQRFGSVVGEANCTSKLGEVALRLGKITIAQAQFEKSLLLYQKSQHPYSIGGAHFRLADLAPEGSEMRQYHLHYVRKYWENIKRPDLLEKLREVFGEIP